jgi:hypothetical protein
MDKLYASEDICSSFKSSKVYAYKYQELEIISYGDVIIALNVETGEKFPTKAQFISSVGKPEDKKSQKTPPKFIKFETEAPQKKSEFAKPSKSEAVAPKKVIKKPSQGSLW